MTTAASLKDADVRIRDAVTRQLEWDPDVDASAIGVTAHEGAVTLTGFIDSYAGKLAAERAAKRVRGVRAVANDVQVRLMLARTDTDIAADVARALELRLTVPAGVQGSVHNGYVTLTGRATWLFQKRDAETAVHHVRGVLGVFNHIAVTGRSVERDVHRRIVQALHRHADIDARNITVSVDGDTVTLNGMVGSWLQREAAEQAAAAAPGIAHIENHVLVEPDLADAVPDEMC